MNSITIQLNNAAIDALHTGDFAKGFNILLRACADQSRLGKEEDHKGHRQHGLVRNAGEKKTQDHVFEYIFEDCSNLLALHSRKESAATLCPHNMLCLKFLRLGSPLTTSQLDSMCSCGVSWVLGYNLSILCAYIGLRIPESGHYYLKKALSLLGPIQRTILKRQSSSLFWTTLKLSVLNNYAFVLRECSLETDGVTVTMEKLLRKTCLEYQLDPIDVFKFQRNLEALHERNQTAAAA